MSFMLKQLYWRKQLFCCRLWHYFVRYEVSSGGVVSTVTSQWVGPGSRPSWALLCGVCMPPCTFVGFLQALHFPPRVQRPVSEVDCWSRRLAVYQLKNVYHTKPWLVYQSGELTLGITCTAWNRQGEKREDGGIAWVNITGLNLTVILHNRIQIRFV